MPYTREAWRLALAALDAEANARHDGRGFAANDGDAEDALIAKMQQGELAGDHWGGMSPKTFLTTAQLTLAGGLRAEQDAAELHNGMAWSADGRTFFSSHSNAGAIFAFDYDATGGCLSNRRVFASIQSAGNSGRRGHGCCGRLLVRAPWRQQIAAFQPGWHDRLRRRSSREPTDDCAFAGEKLDTL